MPSSAEDRKNRGMRVAGGIAAGLLLAAAGVFGGEKDAAPKRDDVALGRELFLREWVPNDSRSHGGDGLGPVFNDSSCVACHNLGGVGGAGPANKNVDIVSAFSSPQPPAVPIGIGELLFGGLFGRRMAMPNAPPKPDKEKLAAELSKIHPGFKGARSVVLHRFSTNPKYEKWQARMKGLEVFTEATTLPAAANQPDVDAKAGAEDAVFVTGPVAELGSKSEQLRQNAMAASFRNGFGGGSAQVGNFLLTTSHRNTPALFGAGLIDSIPDEVLEAAAEKKHDGFPQVTGRVARLADGKIGRFGWKAQTASLRKFAMTACAVELGLHVPEHEQAGLPLQPDYKAPGFDMNEKECDALVGFLKQLPAPVERKAAQGAETKLVSAGKELFASVGCGACHTPKLGEVAGIYSDLLLHDLGPELGDSGNYGVFLPNSADESTEPIPEFAGQFSEAEESTAPHPKSPPKKIVGALRLEWRTPPLWGFRDSGPYLHDGRAETLEQAVAFHGGEARESTRRFFRLKPEQRAEMLTFLKTLTAPTEVATAR